MKKHALFIGINDYHNVPGLHCAAQDAGAVAQTFQDVYGFGNHELTLLTSQPQEGSLSPIVTNIKRHLKRVSEMKGIDLLLVGFWGHGSVIVCPSGGFERYLWASDTGADDLEDTGISRSYVLECLTKARATNACLILDCCQNLAIAQHVEAGFTKAEGDVIARDVLAAVKAESAVGRQVTMAVLNSCSFGQRAYELPTGERGIFTGHLLEAMRQAPNLAAWMNYVSEKVPQTAQRQNATQRPFWTIEGSGDIYFTTAAPTKTEPEDLPVESQRKAEQIVEEEKRKAEKITNIQAVPIVLPKVEQQAGDRMVLTIKGVEFPFRWCPPGTFTMGSPESEEGRCDDEIQRQVTLTRGFWMLETPVSQAMWKLFFQGSWFRGPKRPVECVSWWDCQRYIQKLNAHLAGTPGVPSGYRFSLPTEAQWEYACRAGTTTAYHFGNRLSDDQANFGRRANKTSEVGLYPANAWGLRDMHGNVWEWCSDWYGSCGSKTDPVGPPSGLYRVRRGGDWNSDARHCRSACRDSQPWPSSFRLSLVRVE